jgi:F-type H+-transporting ATPase subunit b
METLAAVLAAEGEPNPLLPHLSELIVGSIAFVLLFLFLRAKVFPVYEKTFAERRDAIEGGMERARAAEEEAKETLAQYREQLADARHEAARLREEAREQGAAIIADMREQAQAEASRLTQQAHQQIEAERVQALTQLRAQVGTLAVDLAGRVVGESLQDDARQRRVVDRFLDELEARAAESNAAAAAKSGAADAAKSGAASADSAGSTSSGAPVSP